MKIKTEAFSARPSQRKISVFVLALLLLNSVVILFADFVPPANATSFTKPSQSNLWINSIDPNAVDKYIGGISTNNDHNIVFPHASSGDRMGLHGFDDTYSICANLKAYSPLAGRRLSDYWYGRISEISSTNSSDSFSGFTIYKDEYLFEFGKKIYVFVPYNASGLIIDVEFEGISFYFQNASYVSGIDFQFASGGLATFETGHTTATWNATMNALVASSTTKSGYGALAIRRRTDTTGSWTFAYSIWNSSTAFKNWIPNQKALDNSTHGSLPTTSSNVFTALGYNNTSTTSGTYKLHFTMYLTFANTMSLLNTRLNQLTSLNPKKSYDDSNAFWYNLYTLNSAVNFNDDKLNKLYYWSKHLINVGHYGKRYFGAGLGYYSGFQVYFQDGAYGVFNSMASGLWDNAKRYLDYGLLYGIDPINGTVNFGSSWYYKKNMIYWNTMPWATNGNGSYGMVRTTVDFLDSSLKYVAYSGNTTFISANWEKFTNMLTAVHHATSNGVLPLTSPSEDGDSSLQSNIIYYHVLKEFASVNRNIGDNSYANILDTRASTLRTQLNKNVGSGGLWSPTANYFVNSSTVSPSDANPQLWLWHNALAINYDVANSLTRKQQILSAIVSKLKNRWGFIDNQFSYPGGHLQSNWYMKLYELAKAFSFMEDGSQMSDIVWSHVNNPDSGLSTRFIFPEFWRSDASTTEFGNGYQYAWSSSPTSMTMEVLLGIKPSINNVRIQPIKPINITTITAMNVKVRNALWNMSVNGDGSYVSSIIIDGSSINSAVIPSSYYSGNHEVQVILGSPPATPLIKDSTAQVSAATYTRDKLTFTVTAASGVTSTTRVYVGDKGQPTRVFKATSWSYDATTNIITVNIIHTSPRARVRIEWSQIRKTTIPKN